MQIEITSVIIKLLNTSVLITSVLKIRFMHTLDDSDLNVQIGKMSMQS